MYFGSSLNTKLRLDMSKWVLITMLPLILISDYHNVRNPHQVNLIIGERKKQSSIVYFDQDSFLRYEMDAESNYVPDFSYAGYKNGEVPLPEVIAIDTIGPVEGNNTPHIQDAIDQLEAHAIDNKGIRGALILLPGTYPIHGTIKIDADGIILRGSGAGSDPTQNTILLGAGNHPESRNIIQVGNDKVATWENKLAGSESTVTSPFVPAGSRSLQVSDPSLYNVGDNIIVFQPSTTAWLESVNFGDTDVDDPWKPGQIDIYYNRVIEEVNLLEEKIILKEPIYDHLDRAIAPAFVYKLDREGIRQSIGIEDLRIQIQTSGQLDEDHAMNAIKLAGVEDCWVRGVTALHFSFAAIDMTVASRISIVQCQALEPHSRIEGSRRYNFNVSIQSNNILFQNCLATDARHAFISNGTSSASGIVFHKCHATGDYTTSEGHRRWSQAMLFDNIIFAESRTNNLLGLYNRGSYGTSHGWATVHSVAWNVVVPPSRRIVLQKPPSRQNYAIGCIAEITNVHQFVHPIGFSELINEVPAITSLYSAQLVQRLNIGSGPDAPARLSIQERGLGLQLNWLDISGQESGYVIEYSLDDGNTFNKLTELPPNSTNYFVQDSELSSDKGVFRIFAYRDDSPPSPFSYSIKLEDGDSYLAATADVVQNSQRIKSVRPIENIHEIFPERSGAFFLVFPNPIQQTINVRIPSTYKKGRLTVWNSKGILLHNEQVCPQEKAEIELVLHNSIPQGLLVIKFENEHLQLTEKLLRFR